LFTRGEGITDRKARNASEARYGIEPAEIEGCPGYAKLAARQAAGEGPRILGTVSGKVGLSTICTVSARESEAACQSNFLADNSKTLPVPAA